MHTAGGELPDLGKALKDAARAIKSIDTGGRAMAQAQKTSKSKATAKAPKKAKTPKVFPLCEDGCGKRTKGGRFLPGHDAKLKSRLFKEARGEGAGAAKAKAEVKRLGWSHLMAK